MIFSDRTLQILKNFSTINQSIYFRIGNYLRTKDLDDRILAEAEIEEDIPIDFAIYNLSQFLTGINSLYKRPELIFDDGPDYVLIKEGSTRSKYFYANPRMIVYPEKQLVFPDTNLQFDLKSNQFDKLIKSSSIYDLPDLSVVGDEGNISIIVKNKKDDRNNYSITVGNTDREFIANFKINHLKIISGDYTVDIADNIAARFTNKDINFNLTYYIALESDSTF